MRVFNLGLSLLVVGVSALTLLGCATEAAEPPLSSQGQADLPDEPSPDSTPGRSSETPDTIELGAEYQDETEVVRISALASFSNEAGRLVTAAMERVKGECLEEYGFDYTPEPWVDQPELVASDRPTTEELQEHGYAWRVARRELQFRTQQDPNRHLQDDPQYLEAIESDCGPRGLEAVGWVEFNEVRAVAQTAESEIIVRILSEPEYLAAEASWASCMSSQGFQFETVDVALAAAESMTGGPSGQAAIELAIADYGCRDETGLTDTRDAVRLRLGQEWLADNPGYFTEIQSLRADVISASEAILAD